MLGLKLIHGSKKAQGWQTVYLPFKKYASSSVSIAADQYIPVTIQIFMTVQWRSNSALIEWLPNGIAQLNAKLYWVPRLLSIFWPLWDAAVIFNVQTYIKNKYLEHPLWHCPQAKATSKFYGAFPLLCPFKKCETVNIYGCMVSLSPFSKYRSQKAKIRHFRNTASICRIFVIFTFRYMYLRWENPNKCLPFHEILKI